MKEELVSKEVAILLKKLNFDLECFYHYNFKDKNILEHEIYDKHIVKVSDLLINYCNYHYSYLAPSQSLALKWLREKYNVVIIIGIDIDFEWKEEDKEFIGETFAEVKYYTYDICFCKKWMRDNVISSEESKFTTYEKAVEAALKKSLEVLIKINE